MAVLPVWALATAAFEYFLTLPRLQPWLIMQTPFWIAGLVHLASASAYPVIYVVRRRLAEPALPYGRAGRIDAAFMAVVLAVVAVPGMLHATGRDPVWPSEAAATDAERAFLVEMTAHHEIGVELARLAAERGTNEPLRQLGRLMVAQQAGEIDVLRHWWSAWFDGELPEPLPEAIRSMPGMPPEAEVDVLATLDGQAFDAEFERLITFHHRGAITMSVAIIGEGQDLRVLTLADQIRHSQRLQIPEIERLAGSG